MLDQNIVGVDVGGTKINVGIINNGQIVEKLRLPTPAQESKEVVVNAIIDGIASLIDGKDICGIGIGVPGLLDEKNGIVYDVTNIPSWNEVHLAREVSNRFKLDVFLTNDANCYVLGEKYYGKGRDYENCVGVTLGTGLGVGFFINGKLYSGLMASAGEVAVIPYLHHNYEYYCSGQFFINEFGLSGEQAFKRASEGDPVARGLFHQYGLHMGNFVKHLLHVLSPEAIFLGGSIKDAFHLFQPSMWEVLNTFPYKRVLDKLVIEKSNIEDAAVLGAAALFEMKKPSQMIVE